MVKNHLKRITAPKTWPIPKRETVFIVRPQTGAHSMATGMPISILLKDVLGLARITRGVRFLLNTQEVLVNGKRVKRPETMIGLMDVVAFPALKASYRILIDKRNTLHAVPIAGEEATLVPLKVVTKTLLPGGRLQLGLHNGWTIIVPKGAEKVGSTVLATFDKKVKHHYPLAEGAFVLVTGGRHVGTTGTLAALTDAKAAVKAAEGEIETITKHLFVLGAQKPAIKLARE